MSVPTAEERILAAVRADLAEVLRQNEERYAQHIADVKALLATMREEIAERGREVAALRVLLPAERSVTVDEALARAMEWAEGRLSHHNTFLTMVPAVEARPATLAAVAVADSAEVAKWAAVAAALAVCE